MDLKQLECFVRVVEFGSITRAAVTLNLSQPVVSRHVRQLEIELKEHLLERNGRGVVPTESGKRLLQRVKGILHQVELAKQEIADQRASPAGKVVVGMPPSVGKVMTVPLASAFKTKFPRASLGVVEGLSLSMQEWLLLGRLDCALLYNPSPNQQVSYQHIWSEALCLIGKSEPDGKALPAEITLADVANYPLIIPGQPNALRNLLEVECARREIPLTISLEIDGIESLLDLVERGMGYAVLSKNAIAGRQRHGLIARKIVDPMVEARLFIATSNQRPLTRLAQSTLDWLLAEIRKGSLGSGFEPINAP